MSLASPPGRSSSLLRGRGDLLARITLAVAQLAAIAWFWPGRGLPLDDAWIHQVVARTFAETGTLGYAPGQHGAAATSYLWAALLAVNFALLRIDPSVWALVLNGASALATGQLLFTLLSRARPVEAGPVAWRCAVLATTLFACASPNVLWFVCSGMEAIPFVALSLAAIAGATAPGGKLRSAIGCGVAAGALALLRPDAVPLGGILAGWMLLRTKDVRRAFAIAAPWAASVALYVGSNVVKTGQAVPSTLAGRRWLWFETSLGLSRVDRVLDFLDAWGTRLGTYTFDTSLAVLWVLTALAAYGALRIVRSTSRADASATRSDRDGLLLLFGWGIFHAVFYALLLPTPGHGGRYQPLTPLLFAAALPLGAAFVLRALARIVGAKEDVRFGWFAALGIAPFVALAAPVATSLRQANALAVAHVDGTEIAAGRWLSTLPEGIVASFDIGGIGWASERRIIDLGGLSDAHTAALLESGRISEWLAERRVRWLVLPQSSEPVLPVFDDYRSRLHLRDNPKLTLEPVRVFETPFAQWAPAIAATWNAAQKQVVYEVRYTSEPGPPDVPKVAPTAVRAVVDPAGLVPRRDRVIAGHMLATLAAWGMEVDVRVEAEGGQHATAPETTAQPNVGTTMTGPCTIRLGWWGFGVDGCGSIADPRRIRATLYELAGRYVDVGDLGGALRAVPHVLAHARRSVDPRFHPPLSPLDHPTPGGNQLGLSRAGGTGLALLLGVLFAALLVEAGARRNVRLASLVEIARARFPALPSTALFVTACLSTLVPASGCARPSVREAIGLGRGAVEEALARGASIDGDGPDAPLLAAADAGDARIVALLVERGARLDVRAPDGATPLHLAARRGHGAATAVIASAMRSRAGAATIDAEAGPRRRTALHDAVLSGSPEAVAALVAAGADTEKADSFEQTPLHLLASIEPARAAAIAPLLRKADPRRADARGFGALHAAAAADNALAVRAIVANADTYAIEEKTPSLETPLDVALRYGRDRAAEALLQAGAALRPDAWPPLHEAARTDAVERAALLLAAGADTTRLARGKTALEVARENGSDRVASLLREHDR